MTAFTAKSYQQDVLSSVKTYFEHIHEDGDENTAFYSITLDLWKRGIAYNGLGGFEDFRPYFCLRVPTGGGKTVLVAKSVALICRIPRSLLRGSFIMVQERKWEWIDSLLP